MPAGHGHVVEEDVAVGVPTRRGDVLVEQESAAGVRAALDHEQRRPGGSASTAPACASARRLRRPPAASRCPRRRPWGSRWSTRRPAPGRAPTPHCAQKRLPSGFSWPHRVQCTLRLLRCRGPAAGLGTGRGRPADDGPDGPSRVGCRELERRAVGHGTSRSTEGQPDVQGEERRVPGSSPGRPAPRRDHSDLPSPGSLAAARRSRARRPAPGRRRRRAAGRSGRRPRRATAMSTSQPAP